MLPLKLLPLHLAVVSPSLRLYLPCFMCSCVLCRHLPLGRGSSQAIQDGLISRPFMSAKSFLPNIPRLWGWDMHVPFEGHPSTQLQRTHNFVSCHSAWLCFIIYKLYWEPAVRTLLSWSPGIRRASFMIWVLRGFRKLLSRG